MARKVKPQPAPSGVTRLVSLVDAIADACGVTARDLRRHHDAWLAINGLEADDLTDHVIQAAAGLHHYHIGRIASRPGVTIA